MLAPNAAHNKIAQTSACDGDPGARILWVLQEMAPEDSSPTVRHVEVVNKSVRN